jgi:ABC-type Zn uptake system ZnuABC Zn-binding protein ZnuA
MKLIITIKGNTVLKKTNISQLSLAMLLPLALFSCNPSDSQAPRNGKRHLVVTSTIIADLAQEVVGEEVKVL